MKKLIMMFLIVVVAGCLSGCQERSMFDGPNLIESTVMTVYNSAVFPVNAVAGATEKLVTGKRPRHYLIPPVEYAPHAPISRLPMLKLVKG